MRRRLLCLLATATLLLVGQPSQSAASLIVFSTDFNSGSPPELSGVTTTVPVQGYATMPDFSGRFLRNATSGNPAAKTTLTLAGLPAHSTVNLDFLFAAIDSWDGSTPAGGTAWPDFFNVAVNGLTIFSRTFDNFLMTDQTYTGAPLTYGSERFYAGGSVWPDSAYDMGLEAMFQNIPHTSSTLVVDWWAAGAGWQGGTDESWAIDNLTIAIDATAVPEPTSLMLLATGLGVSVARRRRHLPRKDA
jgi:hypothetical protein